jgi:hypothetical protein
MALLSPVYFGFIPCGPAAIATIYDRAANPAAACDRITEETDPDAPPTFVQYTGCGMTVGIILKHFRTKFCGLGISVEVVEVTSW